MPRHETLAVVERERERERESYSLKAIASLACVKNVGARFHPCPKKEKRHENKAQENCVLISCLFLRA